MKILIILNFKEEEEEERLKVFYTTKYQQLTKKYCKNNRYNIFFRLCGSLWATDGVGQHSSITGNNAVIIIL